MKRLFVLFILSFFISGYILSQNAWINEFHYDNTGGDVGEFVEVVIENPGSYALSDFEVVLYNGSSGEELVSETINNFINGDTEGNYTFYTWEPSSIQNGAPDGLALVYQGTVITGQFLSYEGSFTAIDGPANGLTSTDIGVDEDPAPSAGNSLQLTGFGSQYSDFSWATPAMETSGSLNNSQFFVITPNPDNPSAFIAFTVSYTEIDLSWVKNAANDDVIIAFNTSNSFGTPVDGNTYAVGNILGGAEIIYIGGATNYSHTSLSPNTQYYYKIWSVDASMYYSSGVTENASTYSLFISEIADPEDPGQPADDAKFVEIYNAGSSAIDFSTETWYLSRQANGSQSSWGDVKLTGIINPRETYVVSYDVSAFLLAYNFNADQRDGYISGNGDDVYALYFGGGHASGVLIDLYGEIDTDGSGTAWEYANSKAVRKRNIISPSNAWKEKEWVIIPAIVQVSTSTIECTPAWHDQDLTWTGFGSSEWSDFNNWSGNGTYPKRYPPDAGCDIIIPELINDPFISEISGISGRASCNNMVISSGAVVTINTQCFLVTGNSIVNNSGTSGLIIKSDDSGDGMLLLGSGTPQATIQRYLIDDQSHLISAPITDASADNLFQDHDPEVYLYEHHEWDDTWQYLVPTSTLMPAGQGFSTWVDDATTPVNHIIAEFDGALMSDDLTLNTSLSYTSSAYGWNLIGNPYAVPLDWDKSDWKTAHIERSIWVWDPVLDDYRWRNSSNGGTLDEGIIPMGQAFFIHAVNNNPSITIPANARTIHHNDIGYYKKNEREDDTTEYFVDHIIMYAQNQIHKDEVWVSFSETGTEGFDNGWDVTKIKNTNRIVNVYVPKASGNQCLEHLPTILPDEERIVEIGFETTVDGEHTLAIDMTYLPNTHVTLEDLKYNQTQDMKYDSIYSFVAFTDDDPNRFRIHFNKTTTGIEFQEFDPKTDQSVQIYSHDKNIYIKKEDVNSSGYVMVYDLYGREVLTQALEHTSLMKIPVHLNNTYLIVKVISDNKVVTSKVYIR